MIKSHEDMFQYRACAAPVVKGCTFTSKESFLVTLLKFLNCLEIFFCFQPIRLNSYQPK